MGGLIYLLVLVGYLTLVLAAGALAGTIGWYVGGFLGMAVGWMLGPILGPIRDWVSFLFAATGFCLGAVLGGVYTLAVLSKRRVAQDADKPLVPEPDRTEEAPA
ncbi:MAG: hypothetical protein H7Z41_01030 [Cytophagales bacterium]|nr:hypothetical protein [Armatimonadota bacterium]